MLGASKSGNKTVFEAKGDQAKTVVEALSLGAFVAIAKEWPESVTNALFGSIAGAEVMLAVFDDSPTAQKYLSNVGRAIVFGGVGVATITGNLQIGASIFTAALTLRMGTSLLKACYDEANRANHMLDALIAAGQATGVVTGLVAKVAKTTSMYVSATAAATGTFKGIANSAYSWWKGKDAKDESREHLLTTAASSSDASAAATGDAVVVPINASSSSTVVPVPAPAAATHAAAPAAN